jgi:hypothetical protein
MSIWGKRGDLAVRRRLLTDLLTRLDPRMGGAGRVARARGIPDDRSPGGGDLGGPA